MSRHPTAKWAQRSDKIYITIDLPDAKDVKAKLEPEGKFSFSATKDGVPYEVDIELFDAINVEESKVNVGLRNVVYVIKKSEKKWWSRLLKQEGKPPVFLKVDWDKWVDEDEENENDGMGFDDMDFSKLDMGEDDFDMDETRDEEDQLFNIGYLIWTKASVIVTFGFDARILHFGGGEAEETQKEEKSAETDAQEAKA